MICERCTLENQATALVCEACQAPLLPQAKMKQKALYVEDDPGTVLNWNVDDQACHYCSFLNSPRAHMCRSCGGAFPVQTSAPVFDVDLNDYWNDPNIEIECQNCTLQNKAGSHVCAMCAAPLHLDNNQHGGASSSHVAEGSTRAKTVCGNEKACFRCMFLNDRLARACVACGNSFKDTDPINVVDVDDMENDEIECEKCTLLNKADAHVCGACSAPLNSCHNQSFMVHSGASSSHDPIGAKTMCRKCTFWNDIPATICACCNSELVAEGEVMEEHRIVCHACHGEFRSKSSGYELMSCNHEFCKPCLWASVADRLLVLTEKNHLDLLNGLDVKCPVKGCGRVLSREDLRLVAGPGILGLLDEWRMTLLTQKVIDLVICRCPHCKELMLPSHQLHSLHRKSLCRALQYNGLTPPSKQYLSKTSLLQRFQGALSSSFLVCSACFVLLCQNCGAGLIPKDDAAHQCDPSLKQCFDIARSIMKLCSAYVQATHLQARKTHKCSGISSMFTRHNLSNQQQMQGRVSPSVDDNTPLSENIISWFFDKGLEGMFEVEGTDAHVPEVEDEADDKVDFAARKRRLVSVVVDKQACKALLELTSSILNILNDNQGVLSPSVVALLCAHDLPYTLLKWLVRNDSIMDITARSDLYWAVLSLMRALSNSWDLLPLFCNPEAKHDCWATQSSRWETAGSVMFYFERLFKQAQFMLQRGEHLLLLDGKDDETGKSTLEQDAAGIASLVADVEATFELLRKRIRMWEAKTSQHQWLADTFSEQHLAEAGHIEGGSMLDNEHRQQKLLHFIAQRSSSILDDDSAAHPSSSKQHSRQAHAKLKKSSCALDDLELESDAAAAPSAALIEAYKKALRPFQFDEGSLLPTHYFRMLVGNSGTMMLNKRRARAISEELTQLNTTLPLEWESSIFLRMDAQRSDVLRALIIGPKGTPYENGVFLFDIFLGERYPDTPPKVQFLTTGAGQVRFNPNLYQCGKVCLSLLGTWNGPGWKPGQSTIMQVLVSIQALVLVADPYYNEPGYERTGNRRDADIYLHQQRLNNVQYSMLPALCSPDPLFLPVIHSHFRLKAPHILHQCNTWIKQESCSRTKKSLQSSCKELRLELNKLTSAPLPCPP